jgi:hypothetical protein
MMDFLFAAAVIVALTFAFTALVVLCAVILAGDSTRALERLEQKRGEIDV